VRSPDSATTREAFITCAPSAQMREAGIVSSRVCMSVCLCVCHANTEQNYWQMLMQLGANMRCGELWKWLHFGDIWCWRLILGATFIPFSAIISRWYYWLYIWHHSGPWSDFSYLGDFKKYWTELNIRIFQQTIAYTLKTTFQILLQFYTVMYFSWLFESLWGRVHVSKTGVAAHRFVSL